MKRFGCKLDCEEQYGQFLKEQIHGSKGTEKEKHAGERTGAARQYENRPLKLLRVTLTPAPGPLPADGNT